MRKKLIIRLLEKDARMQLTEISKVLGIPTSTVFDYLKEIRREYDFTIVRR